MSIFNRIFKIFRPKATDSFSNPIANYPPLSSVTKTLLTTGEMAFYLNLDARTANLWEQGQGPIRPTTEKINGQTWLRWRTADVRYRSKLS